MHLITLRDPVVGYVMPSKIYSCIDSGKRMLFVGSASSDVHLVAKSALGADRYWRVDVGDVKGVVGALHAMESVILSARESARGQTARFAGSLKNEASVAVRTT